jgi:hypothetical protein
MGNGYPHPGINISQIRFGGGFAGLIFAMGSVAIFLAGMPELWYFLAAALALGSAFALALRAVHRRSSRPAIEGIKI